MAAVSKIKLPDNTTLDVHDSRISGVTSSVTENSTSVVTSGGVYNAIVASDKVFIAEYGVTTYNTLIGAINAGKTVYCKYEHGTDTYVYMPLSYSDDTEVDFTAMS